MVVGLLAIWRPIALFHKAYTQESRSCNSTDKQERAKDLHPTRSAEISEWLGVARKTSLAKIGLHHKIAPMRHDQNNILTHLALLPR